MRKLWFLILLVLVGCSIENTDKGSLELFWGTTIKLSSDSSTTDAKSKVQVRLNEEVWDYVNTNGS